MAYKKEDTADCVGPGWRKMVQVLIDYCKAHDIEILQIKEKFGLLRFYFKPFNEDFNKMVCAAEALSADTCEWCGEPGVRRQRNWIKTLCDECSIRWDSDEHWWDTGERNAKTKD